MFFPNEYTLYSPLSYNNNSSPDNLLIQSNRKPKKHIQFDLSQNKVHIINDMPSDYSEFNENDAQPLQMNRFVYYKPYYKYVILFLLAITGMYIILRYDVSFHEYSYTDIGTLSLLFVFFIVCIVLYV